MSFRNRQKGRKASLYQASAKQFHTFATMYKWCVYPAMSNSPKVTAKLSEKSRNRGSSNSFQWYPLSRPRLK